MRGAGAGGQVRAFGGQVGGGGSAGITKGALPELYPPLQYGPSRSPSIEAASIFAECSVFFAGRPRISTLASDQTREFAAHASRRQFVGK